MDKLLKVVPGFANKDFIYQKETLEKKLKISDLDINEDTLQEYILAYLFEKELMEDKMVVNEEVITTSLSSHSSLSYCLYQG